MLAYVISALSNWLYTYILVALLLAAGLYFTLRTRFVQLRMFGESFRVLREEKHEEGGVSSFQALMISTASRVGTGNIAGVSIAICLGGVGAVFWMWLVALLGGASAFIESTLAQIYKVPDGNGGSRGGPAYYIEKVLGSRGLALLFSVFLILTYMVGFNMVASYNLMDSFSAYAFFSPARTPTVVGAVLAVLTAPVEDLRKVEGVGESAAVLLKVAGQIGTRARLAEAAQNRPLSSVETVGAYLLERFAGETHEVVYQLCLDRKCKLLACKRLGEGGIASSGLDIRKLMENAILTSASTVILAHNHPSGVALPSDDDCAATEAARRALDTIGVTLADHIIVADDDFVSMAQSGFFG